jgi:penicillin-binding protein 2
VSLRRAIAESCDSYFYTIGAKMGIDNISFYGDMSGFGRQTGIDLPHEGKGLMPSQKWKLREMREKWYAGETPSVAIGQGALTTTPLQLARALGGVARGGDWYKPHLRKDEGKPQEPVKWTLNPENVKLVIDGMYAVVNEGGTGVRARLPNVEVCGKTGTAQLASNDFLKGTAAGRAKNMKDNAWFEAFAPRSDPEIVVVAFFQHGEHGNYAAPMVRDVIKAYFDKKTRLTLLQQEKQLLQARLASLAPPLIPR